MVVGVGRVVATPVAVVVSVGLVTVRVVVFPVVVTAIGVFPVVVTVPRVAEQRQVGVGVAVGLPAVPVFVGVSVGDTAQATDTERRAQDAEHESHAERADAVEDGGELGAAEQEVADGEPDEDERDVAAEKQAPTSADSLGSP